jgi:hypothetical protein
MVHFSSVDTCQGAADTLLFRGGGGGAGAALFKNKKKHTIFKKNAKIFKRVLIKPK